METKVDLEAEKIMELIRAIVTEERKVRQEFSRIDPRTVTVYIRINGDELRK